MVEWSRDVDIFDNMRHGDVKYHSKINFDLY